MKHVERSDKLLERKQLQAAPTMAEKKQLDINHKRHIKFVKEQTFTRTALEAI